LFYAIDYDNRTDTLMGPYQFKEIEYIRKETK